MSFQAQQLPPLTRKRLRLSNHDYRIALFCVLDVELAATRAMLDEIHDDLPTTRSQNVYVLGELSRHNVVVAVLPTMGNTHSGIVAGRLREDFPAVQFGLMVGVGGGIPSLNIDIRLGDIVVAEATSTTPAVIQFDRGKHRDGNDFEITGHLNKPPDLLVSTVKKLKAQHEQDGSQLSLLINDMVRRWPQMAEDYCYPGADKDQLFEVEYSHQHEVIQQYRSENGLVIRRARHDTQPQIHYGTIGTSNAVLRSAAERDRLGQKYKILCVEMEAAGIVDQLPCLVVRGICDYADSHKDKRWQKYAATTAAAYAKEILQTIPSNRLDQFTQADVALIAHPNLERGTAVLQQDNSHLCDDSRMQLLLSSLTFRKMDARLRNITPALSQTCKWLKSHQAFRKWNDPDKIEAHHGFLWIKGKPGSGKSTLMKTLLAWEKAKRSAQSTLHYFFNARAPDALEKSSIGLYRSLTHQLLLNCPNLRPAFFEQFASKVAHDAVEDWTANELKAFMVEAVSEQVERPLVVLVDALDEGEESDIRQLIGFLEDLASAACSSNQSLRICLSSRHYPEISIRCGESLVMENQQGHEDDIRKYIKQKLTDDPNADMDTLRNDIWQKSIGVFLWVVLVIPLLNQAYDRGNHLGATTMSRCLVTIPGELDDLFETILRKSSEDIGDCVTALQWVLFSKEPLTLTQFCVAIGITSTSPRYLNHDLSLDRCHRCLIDTSRGLVELTKSEPVVVQFIHETVRDFLKQGGLARVDSTLSKNLEAISHDHLKKSCSLYLDNCTAMVSESRWPDKTTFEMQKLYLESEFSLLKYATVHLFEHAEVAECLHVSQKSWIEELIEPGEKLGRWICFRNAFEPAKVRRYWRTASLLYILAIQGHPNLLRQCLACGQRDRTSRERFSTALQAACVNNHKEVTQLLLDSGLDIELNSGERKSAFYAALHVKSQNLVNLLTQYGHQPPISVLEGYLFKCISRGNVWGIQVLIERGCSLNCRSDSSNETPLIYAMKQKLSIAMEVIPLLVKSGADVNAGRDFDGRTVLQFSADIGSEEMVRLVLEAGADVNAFSEKDGTALQTACYSGRENIAWMLIDSGASVNAAGGRYGTVLQAASFSGFESMIHRLIEAGYNVDEPGGSIGTALEAACFQGHLGSIRLLLAAGADVNHRSDKHGGSLQAASINGHESVVQLLLETGANVDAFGGKHGTALQAASCEGHQAIVELLIRAGADVNLVGGKYGTALQGASYGAHMSTIELLLTTGADVNLQSTPYGTALQAACIRGNEPTVCYLLNAGANVNTSGCVYGSALQAASYLGCTQIVMLLLEVGANVNAPRGLFGTALEAACCSGHLKAAQLLLEAGAVVDVYSARFSMAITNAFLL